jgi:phage protein D
VTDPTTRATAAGRRASRATEATGSVRGGRYAGVLRPYQAVRVAGVKDTESGTYVVKQVTHTLTRSEYTQRFTLVRDAVSAPAGAAPAVPAGIA